MLPIKHRFTLDMHSTQSQISIPVMLGDTGREWHINLSDGGKLYTIADGCLAKISIKRPTETHLEEFCTIEGNTTIVYDFSQNQNTAAVEGIHDCDVTLYGLDGKVITTARFTMVVSERAVSGDDIIIYDEDYTAVDAMLTKEAERQAAETHRADAENQRADAETKRVSEFAKLKEQIKSAFIRYSANADGTDFTEQWSNGQNYIGFATGQTAPTDKSKYTWVLLPQGGSAFIRYSSHSDGTDFTEEWSEGQCYIGFAIGQIAPTDKSEYSWALFIDRTDNTQQYQQMFANSLVGNAQGTMVSMDDVAQDALAVVNLRSKNLIPYPYIDTATTKNGVTITVNDDGSITFEGTTTAKTYFFLASSRTFKLPFANYTLSNSIIGTDVGLHIETYKKGAYQQGIGIGSDVQVRTINLSKEYDGLTISAMIESGKTVNTTIYPQLEYGTVATPYTPYVPNDKAVTVKSCGKNLIPYPYPISTVTQNGITFTDNGDGSITVNGTATKQTQYLIVRSADNYILPVGSYVVSGSPIQSTFDCRIQTSHGQVYGEHQAKKFDSDGKTQFFINITVNEGTTVDNLVFKPQLEIGTTATAYEPYIEGETIETTLADGAQLDSIAPNMTIQTDNNAVCIEANYNKDTNIVIEKLTQAIISLGGNV